MRSATIGPRSSQWLGADTACYNVEMKTAHPDIVVLSPEGDCLAVVLVDLSDSPLERQRVIKQMKYLMSSIGCSIGLCVLGEHILLLRDSLEQSHGESIDVICQARLPDYLLPSADEQASGARSLQFEARFQRWLEQLKRAPSMETLPSDLRDLFKEPMISLLRLGEIRAAGPRWNSDTN